MTVEEFFEEIGTLSDYVFQIGAIAEIAEQQARKGDIDFDFDVGSVFAGILSLSVMATRVIATLPTSIDELKGAT